MIGYYKNFLTIRTLNMHFFFFNKTLLYLYLYLFSYIQFYYMKLSV